MCPVTLFLSLAFSDQAFAGEAGFGPEDLYSLKASQVGPVRKLRWKPEIETLPVIRQIGKNGKISSHKGMTYDNFLSKYRELLSRAGFLTYSSPYSIRRGTANAIEGKLSVARRMQVMGHKDHKIFSSHYISKTTFADVQSIVLGTEEKNDLIKRAQGLGSVRDERAPNLSRDCLAKIEENAESQRLAKGVAAAKKSIITTYGSLRRSPEAVFKDYVSKKNQLNFLRRSLKRRQLKTVRESWLEKMQMSTDGLQGVTHGDIPPGIASRNCEIRLEPRQGRIARAFFGQQPSKDLVLLLQDLIKLNTRCKDGINDRVDKAVD